MMSQQESNGRPLISLAHGRHFDGEFWGTVQRELATEGWDSVAPTFDVEEGVVNLDEHASKLREAELQSGAEEFVRVGWSWGANVAIRGLDRARTKKIILPAGAFHPDT